MIHRTCSNPECEKSLPLNETYFRKRANGVYRTDCRKCEAKGRAERRRTAKMVPNIPRPVGARSTQEVLDEIEESHCHDSCRCNDRASEGIDLLGMLGTIGSLLDTIQSQIEVVNDKLQPQIEHIEGDVETDYIIVDNVVYHAEPETRLCEGCDFEEGEYGCGLNGKLHGADCVDTDIIWKKTDIPASVISSIRDVLNQLRG